MSSFEPRKSLLDLHAEMGNVENEKIFEFRALVASCLLRNWDSHFELDVEDGNRLMERVEAALLKLSPNCALRYERDDSDDGRLVHVIELNQLPSGHPQELEISDGLDRNCEYVPEANDNDRPCCCIQMTKLAGPYSSGIEAGEDESDELKQFEDLDSEGDRLIGRHGNDHLVVIESTTKFEKDE